jgi:hypothetical protein
MKDLRDDLVKCYVNGVDYTPKARSIQELEEDLLAMDSIIQ